jgi:P27 family predicted phage terminase small subunit
MRGRKPKPTRLRVIGGNAGKRPLNEAEPKPTVGEPECPDWLDAEAKEKWAEVAPELVKLGILTTLDGAALACFCQCWSEFRQATRCLQREGRVIKSKSGHSQPHPMVSQQRAARKSLREFAALFGMEPSGRVRLQVFPPAGEEDPAEDFFKSRKPGGPA